MARDEKQCERIVGCSELQVTWNQIYRLIDGNGGHLAIILSVFKATSCQTSNVNNVGCQAPPPLYFLVQLYILIMLGKLFALDPFSQINALK